MKRRILVLCLSLALVFMAIAVPADAAVITMGKDVNFTDNRFCVGNTINYSMLVGNPGSSTDNMTLNVSDTYPDGTIERLETGLFLDVGVDKRYYRSYVVKPADKGKMITNLFWVNGTTGAGEDCNAKMEKDSRILDPIISITKVASPTSGALGTDVNFTITVTNTGDCTLDSVEVVDTLPVGMSFVSADSGGSESPPESGTIIWDLGTMVSGATHAPIHLVAHIDVGAAGPLTNNVLATGTPKDSMCDDVTDSDDAVVTVTYSIAGMKFNDLNGNGVKDAGEPGLPGWTINLEQPAGTVINSTTTAADGSYTFTNLEPGDYTVSETVKAGWVQTCPPTPGTYSVTLTDTNATDKDFGNRGAMSISGMKFNDLNGNGVKDAGEPGLPGWTIYNDSNNNGVFDPGELNVTTGAGGAYSFDNLEPGTYKICEVVKDGWAQTSTPICYDITLTDTSSTGNDFGNRGAMSISGMKFNDLNGNGVKDAGEPGLPGWTIYNDSNNNGVFDPGELNVTTGAGGAYSFDNLEPGTYKICEVVKDGWAQTSTPICYDITLTDTSSTGNDFGNRGAMSISGMKFNDLNGNGVKDAGEPGLPGWTIYNDSNNNGVFDPGELNVTTGAGGAYSFDNLEPGTYKICEVVKDGWAQTSTPICYDITLTDTSSTGNDFGNRGAMSISGMKFNDLNGNGVKDAGEPGLPGWTIYNDSNNNGVFDPGELNVTTGAGGAYSFDNLEPGTYKICEVVKDGWAQTSTPICYDITLTDTSSTGNDFGNRGAMSISGMKFNDLNGNGVKDAGEPGLPGWTIYNDSNNNGVFDPGELNVTTGAGGAYSFDNLEPGTYKICEVVKDGWAQTSTPICYDITLTDTSSTGNDFGNRGAMSISGMKFNDLNGNGVKDAGEPGLPGWTIYNDSNNNGVFDPGELNVTTGAGGAYSFDNLEPGTYKICEVVKDGWAQTSTPICYDITLTDTSSTGNDFGNRGAMSISGMKFNDLNGNGVRMRASQVFLAGRYTTTVTITVSSIPAN